VITLLWGLKQRARELITLREQKA